MLVSWVALQAVDAARVYVTPPVVVIDPLTMVSSQIDETHRAISSTYVYHVRYGVHIGEVGKRVLAVVFGHFKGGHKGLPVEV